MLRGTRTLLLAALLLPSIGAGCKTDSPTTTEESPSAGESGLVDEPSGPGAVAPPPPVTEVEPNDTSKQAMDIRAAEPVSATVSSAKDVDVFRVDPGGAVRTLRAEVTGAPGTDLELALLDPAGKGVVRSVNNVGVGEGETITNVQIDRPAYVRVRARKRAQASAPYTLVVTLSAPDENAESEPNGSQKKATPFAVGSEREGWINNPEDRDVFKLEGGGTAALELELTPVSGVEGELRLYRADRNAASVVPVPDGERLTLRVAPPGTTEPLYVELRSRKGFNVADRYRIAVREAGDGPAADPEPDDAPALAAPVTVDGQTPGVIGWPGDVDWYTFDGPGEAVARVEIDGVPGLTLSVAVAGADGKIGQQASGAEAGAKVLLPNAPLPGGKRLIRVAAGKGEREPSVPYRLAVTVRDAAGEEREPNDRREDAGLSPLEVGFARRGYVSHGEDVDWFKLDLTALASGRILTLRARAPDGARLAIRVEDAAGESAATIDDVPAGEERTATQFFNPGIYYVQISSPDRKTSTGAPYSLSVIP